MCSCTIQDDRTQQLNICGLSEGLRIYCTVSLKKKKENKRIGWAKLVEVNIFSLLFLVQKIADVLGNEPIHVRAL